MNSDTPSRIIRNIYQNHGDLVENHDVEYEYKRAVLYALAYNKNE
jgi:hypothetical protein